MVFFPLIQLLFDDGLELFQFFFGQCLFLLLSKNRDPHVTPRIEVEVVNEVLQLVVGGNQAIVQRVAVYQLPQRALAHIDFAGDFINMCQS